MSCEEIKRICSGIKAYCLFSCGIPVFIKHTLHFLYVEIAQLIVSDKGICRIKNIFQILFLFLVFALLFLK